MTEKILLTSGCSFTIDRFQKTWADYLAESIDHRLCNTAGRGAGIDFIKHRVIYECSKNPPDLVMIMLPSVDRFDLYVDPDHPLKHDLLKISSWQDGMNPNLVDINGKISTMQGFCLSGGEHRGYKKLWYKYYYSEESMLLKYWTDVLTLELYLKSRKIPYKFTMAYDRFDLVEQQQNRTGHQSMCQYVCDQIDWQNFIFYDGDRGFLSYTRDQGFQIKNSHPIEVAHQSWVNNIVLPELMS
jgi:hypothetical protein